MWEGGNNKTEIANPARFEKKLKRAGATITVNQLAGIKKLPVMQQLRAMQNLSDNELQALDDVERLCNLEVAFLLQNLKPNTVASVITQYKKVLDTTGYKEHPYQLYFKLPTELMTIRKNTYRASVMAENKQLKPFSNETGYLNMALKLMQSKKSYIRVAIGLCASTGRRPSEILTTAEFSKTGEYNAIFKGQLKTKGSGNARDNYEIPLLLPADDVIEALAVLRDKRDFSTLPVPASKTLAQVVNSKTAKSQSEAVKMYFDTFIPSPKTYNLRAIYALLCGRKHRPKTMTEQAYIASILGHSENDSTTASSYLDFYYKED